MSAGVLTNIMVSAGKYIIQASIKNLMGLNLNYVPFLSVTRETQLKNFRWYSVP
jgi:hypothetical protein